MENPGLSDVIGAKLTCALLCNSLKVEGGSSVVSAAVSLRVRCLLEIPLWALLERSLNKMQANKSLSCYDKYCDSACV